MSVSPPVPVKQLENIHIASPCRADWNAMPGDDVIRFCDQCQLRVYNLSAMNRQDAQAFLADQTGRTCVRMYRRADGTILTADCPVGLALIRQRMQRLWMAGLAIAGVIIWTSLTAFGSALGWSYLSVKPKSEGLFSRWRAEEPGFMFGDVCVPPPIPIPASTIREPSVPVTTSTEAD